MQAREREDHHGQREAVPGQRLAEESPSRRVAGSIPNQLQRKLNEREAQALAIDPLLPQDSRKAVVCSQQQHRQRQPESQRPEPLGEVFEPPVPTSRALVERPGDGLDRLIARVPGHEVLGHVGVERLSPLIGGVRVVVDAYEAGNQQVVQAPRRDHRREHDHDVDPRDLALPQPQLLPAPNHTQRPIDHHQQQQHANSRRRELQHPELQVRHLDAPAHHAADHDADHDAEDEQPRSHSLLPSRRAGRPEPQLHSSDVPRRAAAVPLHRLPAAVVVHAPRVARPVRERVGQHVSRW